MEKLEDTYSICPACNKEGKIVKIPAEIIEENGKVYITKKCKEHGSFKEIYFSDADVYKKWLKYKVTGTDSPDVKTSVLGFPSLYDVHKSQSVLTNLLVTNRCNLRCSYCFMNAGASGQVYEPTLDEIRELLVQARNEKPLGSKALKLADSAEYCKKIKDHGVNTIYMSFDGVTKETNPWIDMNKKAIDNMRKVNLKCVLVPVLIDGKNLHETGKIVKFALDNMDIIRGVNFQPISFCGRVTKVKDEKRDKQRVDYVKMIAAMEKEFDNKISRDDFYPVPFVFPVSKLIEMLKGESQVEFTAHPGCGGATYIFVGEDGEPIPVTRFIDVEGLLDFINKESQIKGPLKKIRVASAFLKHIDDFVDYSKAPKGFDLKKLLKDAAIGGSYDSLRGFHYKSLFIGSMWFQDAFNLNIDRLKRCVIHYTTFEGIVPFCAYNGLGIGDKIRDKHSVPIKKWEEKTGRKLKDDLRKDVPLT